MKTQSLFDLVGTAAIDWYLVFCDTDRPRWWTWALKPGFSHVYALKWDGYNWLIFGPNMAYTEVSVLPYCEPDIHTLLANTPCSAILRVTGRVNTRCSGYLPELRTCVSQVKSLIGLRRWRIFTPWQLAQYLRGHHDCSTIKAETPEALL